eukprot:3698558-Amphidinium_carterae.1
MSFAMRARGAFRAWQDMGFWRYASQWDTAMPPDRVSWVSWVPCVPRQCRERMSGQRHSHHRQGTKVERNCKHGLGSTLTLLVL